MGDFQEPYGAIFGEFDKLGLCSCRFCWIFTVFPAVKLWKTFSYNLAKALQDVCNLRLA
jgi:hypothetical protein